MKKNHLALYCTENGLTGLLAEWDTDRNGALKPCDVSKTSRTQVYWRCAVCGYGWQTQVASRAIGKTGCPECYRSRLAQKKIRSES